MSDGISSALVWFRRDLRHVDHAALYHALKSARKVWCVFVFDRTILDPLPRCDRRVAFIRSAQRVGLTLDEVAEALATLPEGRTPTKADWSRLSRSWRPRIDAQIERLERLRDKLDSCIGCGCLSLRTCALNNPADEVAPRGPGAVFLEPSAGR